jgi:hypothetical protein
MEQIILNEGTNKYTMGNKIVMHKGTKKTNLGTKQLVELIF